jgi:hypothetical protein
MRQLGGNCRGIRRKPRRQNDSGQSRLSRWRSAGIQICRRKWMREAVLRQLGGPEEPPAALGMVPRRDHAARASNRVTTPARPRNGAAAAGPTQMFAPSFL